MLITDDIVNKFLTELAPEIEKQILSETYNTTYVIGRIELVDLEDAPFNELMNDWPTVRYMYDLSQHRFIALGSRHL